MGDWRRHTETVLDVGLFAALMLPAAALGLAIAAAAKARRPRAAAHAVAR